jgi:hypothetical protein
MPSTLNISENMVRGALDSFNMIDDYYDGEIED